MTDEKVKHKVLFVDDEASVLSGIKRQLHGKFDVYTAEGGKAGLELLRTEGPFAVVVSDMRMPQMDGAEFLSKVKVNSSETERALLTGHADVNAAIAAVNEGQIFRYLVKPCEAEVLIETLEEGIKRYDRFMATRRMLAENKELLAIAAEDPLLGIPNRRALERDLDQIHGTSVRYQRVYSLVLFKVNEFDKYNEFYGTQGGEKVLEAIANQLSFSIRTADHLFRSSEDSFALVLPETARDGAEILAVRLLNELDRQHASPSRGFAGNITVSAGLTEFNPAEDEKGTWLDVLKRAEATVEQAKDSKGSLAIAS